MSTSTTELNNSNIKITSDEDHRSEWSYEATKVLLKIYDEKSDMLETGIINTQKKLWELTAKALGKKGFYYTASQCENKWKALKRAYRTKLERIQKFGSYKRTCPFEREVTEILSKRPNDSITRSYSFKIQSIKKDEELFENINLNEPPGFTKDESVFEQDNSEMKNITILEENLEDFSNEEQHIEYKEPAYTVIQQESDSGQAFVAEELADLKRIIAKQSRINTQVLRETSKIHEKILSCLEKQGQRQSKALEIEEKKVAQQNEIINQMKVQNALLQNLLEKFV